MKLFYALSDWSNLCMEMSNRLFKATLTFEKCYVLQQTLVENQAEHACLTKQM